MITRKVRLVFSALVVGVAASAFGGIPVNPKLPMSFGVDSAAFARAADGRLTASGATESRSR